MGRMFSDLGQINNLIGGTRLVSDDSFTLSRLGDTGGDEEMVIDDGLWERGSIVGIEYLREWSGGL